MRRRIDRSKLARLLVLGAVSGCGSDSGVQPGQTQTGSSTDGGQCVVGALGCECTPGGGCDATLECIAGTCNPSPNATSGDSGSASTSGAGDSTGVATTGATETGDGTTGGDSSTGAESGSSGGAVYDAVGPQVDVPMVDVVGWQECWSEPYDSDETPVADILAACTGDELMLACHASGEDVYRLLAHAPRADVLMEQPWPFTPHIANGSGWYFFNPGNIGEIGAIGFVLAGDTTAGGVCDVSSMGETNSEMRLCWHIINTHILGGFRCGEALPLNEDASFQRVMLQR